MKVFNFPYTGEEQIFISPKEGCYKLEVWGAQGGFHFGIGLSSQSGNKYAGVGRGGYGGYAVGVYCMPKHQKLYVYVGGKGANESRSSDFTGGGWNGGGSTLRMWTTHNPSGGGSTDISLVRSDISIDSSKRYVRDQQSYYSRIIVAGGGGGGCNQGGDHGEGGNGGGYKGTTGTAGYRNVGLANGGAQTSSGAVTNRQCSTGSFGYGSGTGQSQDGASGGGGWWGGNEANDA